MIELFLVLLTAAAIAIWWQLMQAKLKARKAADHVCATHGLQLLDDTVSLSSVTWNFAGSESRILINYSFEFATNGAKRRAGTAQFSVPGNLSVTLDLEQGQLIEHL